MRASPHCKSPSPAPGHKPAAVVLLCVFLVAQLFFILPAALAPPALAASHKVADAEELRSAVAEAGEGDTIRFSADITLDGHLRLDKPLTFTGGHTLHTGDFELQIAAEGALQLEGRFALDVAGKLYNDGRVEISRASRLSASGTLENHGTMVNSGGFTAAGAFNNGGSFHNSGNVQSSGTLVNAGSAANTGSWEVTAGSMHILADASFTNSGRGILNAGFGSSVANTGTLDNAADYNNLGVFTNQGVLINTHRMENFSTGEMHLYHSGQYTFSQPLLQSGGAVNCYGMDKTSFGSALPDTAAQYWYVVFQTDDENFMPQGMTQYADGFYYLLSGALLPEQNTPPRWAGHVFAGWAEDGLLWDYATPVTRNLTLTACWEEEPPPHSYAFLSGDGQTYSGSAEGIAFTLDAPFDKLTAVRVDGTPLQAGADYTVDAANASITLLPAFCAKLTAGSHSLLVVFGDKTASGNFVVTLPPVSNPQPGAGGLPLTGSRFIWAVFFTSLLAAGLFITVMYFVRYKKRDIHIALQQYLPGGSKNPRR